MLRRLMLSKLTPEAPPKPLLLRMHTIKVLVPAFNFELLNVIVSWKKSLVTEGWSSKKPMDAA